MSRRGRIFLRHDSRVYLADGNSTTPLFVAKVNCEDRLVAEWIRSESTLCNYWPERGVSLSAEMLPSSDKRCIEGEIICWGMRMVWRDGIESIPTGDGFRCGLKVEVPRKSRGNPDES